MNNYRRIVAILLAGILFSSSAVLTGCTNTTSEKKNSYRIVTSFYPMYVFASNLLEGIPGVTLRNLTQPQTGCLHDYQMKPADMVAIEHADLFIINGAGMEGFLDKVRVAYPELKVVEAAQGIPLLKDLNGEVNPHVWVSISYGMREIENIYTGLVKALPEKEAELTANKEKYQKKLESLRMEMHKSLAPFKGRDIVTFHEAFPYFAEEFNFNIAGVIEREPGSAPSPVELRETIRSIRNLGIKSVFTEPQYDSRIAATIERETGVQIYNLDPFVTGVAGEDPGAYEKVMRLNMLELIKAMN